jgi:hypothetical protein
MHRRCRAAKVPQHPRSHADRNATYAHAFLSLGSFRSVARNSFRCASSPASGISLTISHARTFPGQRFVAALAEGRRMARSGSSTCAGRTCVGQDIATKWRAEPSVSGAICGSLRYFAPRIRLAHGSFVSHVTTPPFAGVAPPASRDTVHLRNRQILAEWPRLSEQFAADCRCAGFRRTYRPKG